jgi:hypothetical protein
MIIKLSLNKKNFKNSKKELIRISQEILKNRKYCKHPKFNAIKTEKIFLRTLRKT